MRRSTIVQAVDPSHTPARASIPLCEISNLNHAINLSHTWPPGHLHISPNTSSSMSGPYANVHTKHAGNHHGPFSQGVQPPSSWFGSVINRLFIYSQGLTIFLECARGERDRNNCTERVGGYQVYPEIGVESISTSKCSRPLEEGS